MATTPQAAAKRSELQEGDRRLFPTLTAEQLSRLSRHGAARSCDAGEVLLEPGAQVFGIFVVVSGQVDIVRMAGETEHLVVRLGAGQFTGEAGTLAGRPALVRIRAVTPARV